MAFFVFALLVSFIIVFIGHGILGLCIGVGADRWVVEQAVALHPVWTI
jgi:hypothetical protein